MAASQCVERASARLLADAGAGSYRLSDDRAPLECRYPWSAQAATALAAGLDPAVIEAINAGAQPDFTDGTDAAVRAAARERLATGTLGEDGFRAAEAALGYRRLAEVVGTIGHFCTTAMMANVVGAEPAPDAASKLRP